MWINNKCYSTAVSLCLCKILSGCISTVSAAVSIVHALYLNECVSLQFFGTLLSPKTDLRSGRLHRSKSLLPHWLSRFSFTSKLTQVRCRSKQEVSRVRVTGVDGGSDSYCRYNIEKEEIVNFYCLEQNKGRKKPRKKNGLKIQTTYRLQSTATHRAQQRHVL